MLLSSERARLRPLELADLERTRGWVNDPRVARGLLRSLPASEAAHRAWFESLDFIRNMVFAIIDAGTGEHVGNAALTGINPIHSRCLFWIYLGAEGAQGKGLAFEAARLLLDYAFGSLNLNKVSLETAADNERAKKLYHALGFALEGTLVQEYFIAGRYIDVLRMGLVRSGFSARPV